MPSLLELEEERASSAIMPAGALPSLPVTATAFSPTLEFPQLPAPAVVASEPRSLLALPEDEVSAQPMSTQTQTGAPPTDVKMSFRLTGPGSLTEKPAEKFTQGMELAGKGFKSMLNIPGVSQVMGVPAQIVEAWGGDPEKLGVALPDPEQILPELPKDTPKSLRPFLEYVRSSADPFIGAAAATLGPPTAVVNAVSELIVEQPTRTAIKNTLKRFKEDPDSVPTVALVPLAVYALKQSGYTFTDKDIEAIAESGATLAGVLTGVGVGNALMKSMNPVARMAGRLIGGEPEKPIVDVAPGQAPMLPKPGKVMATVKKFFMPRHAQTPEFNQMYNEMAGRRILGNMQARRVFSDLEKTTKSVAKETGVSTDELRVTVGNALKGVEGTTLHPKLESAVRPVREQINKWQQKAADVGLIGQEIVDESVDQYLYRGYLAKLTPDTWVPPEPVLGRARKYLGDNMRVPVGRGDPARASESIVLENVRRQMQQDFRQSIREGRPDVTLAQRVTGQLKKEVLGNEKANLKSAREFLGTEQNPTAFSRMLAERLIDEWKLSPQEAAGTIRAAINALSRTTIAVDWKDLRGEMLKTIIQRGGVKPDVAGSIAKAMRETRGAFDEMQSLLIQTRKARLTQKEVAELERKFQDALEKATGRGPVSFRKPTPDEVEGAIERILSGDDTFAFHAQQGGQSARINLGPFTRRKDIPEEIRDLMGEIKEGSTAAALTISNLTRSVATKRFLDDFAKGSEIIEFGNMRQRVPWVVDTRVPGYAKIEGKAWGPLDGKFVLEKYADDLKGFVDDMAPNGTFWKWQAHLMNFFKVSKTVANPATHLRNILGNFMFADYAGVPVWDLRNAKYYMRAANELLTSGQGLTAKGLRSIKKGVIHGDEGVTPLVREAIENGAIQTEMFGSEVFRETLGIYAKQSPAKATWETAKRPVKALGRIYNAEDQITKMAAYLKQKDLGKSAAEAGLHVRKWTPNYRDVSPAVETARSSIAGAPFVTFYSEAIRINAKAAREHPIKFAKWIMMGPVASAASVSALGIAQEEWERVKDMLPSYQDQPLTVLLPTKDNDGNLQIVDFTYIHPLGSLFAARRQGLDVPFLGDLVLNNPILNTALEISNDFNAFTRQESRKPGQPIAMWIMETLNRNFSPPWSPTGLISEDIESAPIAREIGRAIRRSRGEYAPGRYGQSLPLSRVLMNELGPIRILPVDENMVLTGLQEKSGELNKLARGLRSLGIAAAKGRISIDTVEDRAQRIMREMRKVYKEKQRDWSAPRAGPEREASPRPKEIAPQAPGSLLR